MGVFAGDFDNLIEVLRAQVAVDRGEPKTTGWTVVAAPWAEVVGLNGREAVIGHILEGISVYRIRLYWDPAILPTDQIRLNGSLDLNIKSVSDPDGKREQLLIIADTDGAQKTT